MLVRTVLYSKIDEYKCHFLKEDEDENESYELQESEYARWNRAPARPLQALVETFRIKREEQLEYDIYVYEKSAASGRDQGDSAASSLIIQCINVTDPSDWAQIASTQGQQSAVKLTR